MEITLSQRDKRVTRKNSPGCSSALLVRCNLFFCSRNLVEQESVLEKCRISRNFSPNKRSTESKNAKHKAFAFFFFSTLLSKKIKNTTTHDHQHCRQPQYTSLSAICIFGAAPIEIWLILPVVICLFQGLSHACLRITALQESAHGSLHQTQSAAKMLRKRIIGYLVRNAKLIHELMGSFRSTRRRLAEGVVTDPADE